MEQIMNTLCVKKIRQLVSFLLLVVIAFPLYAVDGVIEINQAKALAGGVVPGDLPGFPVTIKETGSFVLTSNLHITDDSDGIIVLVPPPTGMDQYLDASNVTIDLNGFTIKGAFIGSQGVGIKSHNPNTSIFNGTIKNMGTYGAALSVHNVVKNVLFENNGSGLFNHAGVRADHQVTLKNNRFIGNFGHGINVGVRSIITDNIVHENRATGILIRGIEYPLGGSIAVVQRNVVSFNNGTGIETGDTVMIKDNVVKNNDGSGIITGNAATIVNNTVENNSGPDGSIGIKTGSGSIVTGNSVRGHRTSLSAPGYGLQLANDSGYSNNVLTDNNLGNTSQQVSGGIEIGINLCGANTSCP